MRDLSTQELGFVYGAGGSSKCAKPPKCKKGSGSRGSKKCGSRKHSGSRGSRGSRGRCR